MNNLKIQSSRLVTNELKPFLEIKIMIDLEEAQDGKHYQSNFKLKEAIISQLTDFLNQT